MTANHSDLGHLSRAELKQLAKKIAEELEQREQEDRAALEEKLRAMIEDHGFDPDTISLTGKAKRAARRANNGGHIDD